MEFLTSAICQNFWGIVLVAFLIVATVGVYYKMNNLHHSINH